MSLPSSQAPVDLTSCGKAADCFFAATAHGVYEYTNQNWRRIFFLSDAEDEIVRILFIGNENQLFAQSKNAIYEIDPKTTRFKMIYSSRDEDKKPLGFFAGEKQNWLGTQTGIWKSAKLAKEWQKNSALADHLPVSLIHESSIGLFFSANGDLRLAEEDSMQTVLKLFDFNNASDDTDLLSEEFEGAQPRAPQQTFFDFVETEESFYLATSKGVFQSRNGLDWKPLSGSGLRSALPKRLAWNSNKKQLIGICEEGFFAFDAPGAKWQSQNDGLAKTHILSALHLEHPDTLLAANREGLWRWIEKSPSGPISSNSARAFNKLIRLEPSARDIHKRVIRYSDTGNGKIKRWHAQSRAAALLPSLSAGKDWGTSNNIDLDRAGANDPDRFIDGPWDRDRGADISASWNLGDFIFSSSQTSIDSRSKLMVDQRNDLLSEATRLFYERRRLQAEIIQSPSPDEAAHLERLLRLDELTSLIDALTDGYLSKTLEQIYQQNHELNQIWEYQK